MKENFDDEFETLAPLRPVFLKVLCILTFIGSGYFIINSVVTYFKADTIAKVFTDVKIKIYEDSTKRKNAGKPENANFAKSIMKHASEMSTPENLRKMAIGTFISSILCLFGALLMWHLKRPGFYLYVVGTIIGIAIPFYLFGNNFLTNLQTCVTGFIGVLFIIFYAMNFKSLK